MNATRWITILGSTGSVGRNTLDVIARHPERFRVFALSCATRWQELLAQCRVARPVMVAVSDADAALRLRAALAEARLDIRVLAGDEGVVEIASHPQVDIVMAAIVGAAGLMPTISAATAGKRVLLANKEALVMAGRFFMDAVRTGNAELLPIDSEHNAIFQCLPSGYRTGTSAASVRKLLLTASGGPLRTCPLAALDLVTPEQAVAHPNWVMGPKISVDSATMMNKGLEVIEACWLFHTSSDRIEVVIHPQSVIHSLVEFIDGSVLAQLSNPDMRVPIASALAWPERIESGVERLDLIAGSALTFEAPELERFPCLQLAMQAAHQGLSAPIALNAANEIAVAAFLAGRIGFTAIAETIAETLNVHISVEPESLFHVQAIDRAAREVASRSIQKRNQ